MSFAIDLQKIADELDFDLEDVKMLMDVFLESAIQSLKELKSAIDANDFESIYTSSHDIKGSAGNLLLMDISNSAKEIENHAKKENSINYAQKYEKLKLLIDALED